MVMMRMPRCSACAWGKCYRCTHSDHANAAPTECCCVVRDNEPAPSAAPPDGDATSVAAHHGGTTASTNPAELRVPDLQVGLLKERMPVVHTEWVDAYYWTCQVCGWLGTGLTNIDSAQAEAATHFRSEHDPREVYIVRRDQRRL